MNKIFDLNRFVNYMKRNILISQAHYLYLFGILIGAYFFGLLIYAIWEVSWAAGIYFFLILSILLGPSVLEKNITKYNGVMEFTFPVSTFERFLSLILRYAVLYPIICFGSYYLLNLVFGNIPLSRLNGFAESMSIPSLLEYKTFQGLIGGQSIFLLGYLYFNKNPFIKTCFTCIIVMLGLTILSSMVLSHKILKAIGSDMFTNITGIGESSNLMLLGDITQYFLMFVFPVGLWIVGFFKLREKEI